MVTCKINRRWDSVFHGSKVSSFYGVRILDQSGKNVFLKCSWNGNL